MQGVNGRRWSKGSTGDEGLGDVWWEGKSDVKVARDGGDAMEARQTPANPVTLAGPFFHRGPFACVGLVFINQRSS